MYEILSATIPYYEIDSNRELVTQICNGLRLKKPTKLPVSDEFWTLIQSCWLKLDQRPTFQQIYDQLAPSVNQLVSKFEGSEPPLTKSYFRTPVDTNSYEQTP